MEDRPSVRTNLAKEIGYTCLSILHRLHNLYGFDVLQDLVYDAMHNVPLNVVSHHLHYYIDNEILSPTALERKLREIPWTPVMYAQLSLFLYSSTYFMQYSVHGLVI